MSGCPPAHGWLRAPFAVAVMLLVASSAPAELLPWEVTVAEIEAGRLRNLAQRLNKQYLLYQLHLGDMRKSDLVDTANRIDRLLEWLEKGSPSHSMPAAWTTALEEQVRRVNSYWGPLRRIAVASPYDAMRVARQYVPAQDRRGDPLLIRYFDYLTLDFVAETETLLALYHEECTKTGLEVCPAARSSGYGAMVIERAMREAICVVAGIEVDENRKRLKQTILDYQALRRSNDESPFFAAALNPERGVSARAAGELLVSLREDWDTMQAEFTILQAGDEKNFDVERLLVTQTRLVEKVERLTGALVRFASMTYGS